MGDILKEAIADAKAVRETALQNAKMALEEAFTPQLKSMLSAKLKEDEMGDEEETEEGAHEEEDDDAEEGYHEGEHEDEDEKEEGAHEGEEDDEAEEGMHEEGIVEIDGVKYAPVVSEEEDEEEVEEEGIEIEEENLDLEAIIRELETELKEEDDAYDDDASPDRDGLAEEDDAYDDDASPDRDGLAEEEDIEIDESIFTEEKDDDDEDELDEVDKSSGIGKGDNKEDDTDKASGIGTGDNKLSEVQAELKEYKEAVSFLKDKLHEVNILNAKLLFTNKLFKEFALDNNQKLKVVETFDRTQSTREIKLVYSTLAEQFSENGSINKRNPIKESASSTIGSTKPSKESKKVISEEDNVADRFRKLAGIING